VRTDRARKDCEGRGRVEEKIAGNDGNKGVPFAITRVNHTKQMGKWVAKEEERCMKPFVWPPNLSFIYINEVVFSRAAREADKVAFGALVPL